MYLTTKIKLKPSSEQEEILWQTSDSARRLYNLALEHRKLIYNYRKHSISMYEQKKDLTYLRQAYFPELHSQTAQEVTIELNEDYVSFFKNYKTAKT